MRPLGFIDYLDNLLLDLLIELYGFDDKRNIDDAIRVGAFKLDLVKGCFCYLDLMISAPFS